MPRPKLTSRLSLPSRLKNGTAHAHAHAHANGSNSSLTSTPASRSQSPRRTMNDQTKPGLLLRANVIKVGRRTPRSHDTTTNSGCRAGIWPQRTGAALRTR